MYTGPLMLHNKRKPKKDWVFPFAKRLKCTALHRTNNRFLWWVTYSRSGSGCFWLVPFELGSSMLVGWSQTTLLQQ